MKTPILWIVLTLSVAGNVYQAMRPAPDARVDSTVVATVPPPAVVASKDSATTAASGDVALNQRPALSTSADVRRLAEEMRRAGYPRSVVRAVVTQSIMEQFAAKDPVAKPPFWQRAGPDAETQKAQKEFLAARNKEIEDVLGRREFALGAIEGPAREAKYGKLPDDKILAIQELQREYFELRQKHVYTRSNVWREGSPEMQRMKAIQEEERADIKALLSPEEFQEYNLRNAPGALSIMQASRGLNLSEGEYTTLLGLQQGIYEKNPNAPLSGDPKQLADTYAMLGQARQMLGDERFFLFLEGHQPVYSQVSAFIRERSAPLNNNQRYELFQVQRDLESLNYRRGSSEVSQAEINESLTAIKSRLGTLLGPQLAEEYLTRGPAQSHVRMLGTAPKP